MSEKTLNNIRNEAGKLRAAGFPFHSQLLIDAIDAGKGIASTIERVAIMLERGKRFGEAKRLRGLAQRTAVSI